MNPFDENAIDYSKCLGHTENVEECNYENKLMSLKEFENIIGFKMMEKMKALKSQGVITTNSSPTLFKLWLFFQSDHPQQESSGIEIQYDNNTATNVNLTKKNNLTTLKITMTPATVQLLLPSTFHRLPLL